MKELLVHPTEKSQLFKENIAQPYQDEHFTIKSLGENLVMILPKESSESTSDFHSQLNSSFSYQEHYQRDAEVFDYDDLENDQITNEENRRLHQKILDSVPKDANLILDVGCGNAWLSKSLINKGRKVISMDISTINPTRAVDQLPSREHLGLIADVYHLPFAENSIDCIVASEVMEHVPDPKKFTDQLFSILKPNGKIIITTPYNEAIQLHLCVHCNQLTPSNAHLHSFNEENIHQFLPVNSANYELSKFSNKYFLRARIYYLLRFLPFNIWKNIDDFANYVLKKPLRLLIEIKK